MKNFNLLFSDTKNFMANEVNRIFIGFLLVSIVFFYFVHIDIKHLEQLSNTRQIELQNQIEKLNKKVDFRYFNTTRSLEELYGVSIDTRTGDIIIKPNLRTINNQ